jgi:carbonic anhydrase
MQILAKALLVVQVAAIQFEGVHHNHHKHVESGSANKTSKKNVMKHSAKKTTHHAGKKTDAEKCWSYENVKHWETVYEACKTKDQSPVALNTECRGNGLDCTPSDQPLGKHFVSSPVAGAYLSNNGHFMELVAPAYFSTITLGKLVWKSARVQFHTPSEHTMNGVRYPAEMQIVFTPMVTTNKWTLVTSMFIKEGYNRNSLLSSIGMDMVNLPRNEGDKMYVGGPVDLADGLKGALDGTFAGYEGTLTSPPCTNNVLWFVAENPLEASATQISNLERRFPEGNNRPTHPIGSRMVYRDWSRWSSHANMWSIMPISLILVAIASLQ